MMCLLMACAPDAPATDTGEQTGSTTSSGPGTSGDDSSGPGTSGDDSSGPGTSGDDSTSETGSSGPGTGSSDEGDTGVDPDTGSEDPSPDDLPQPPTGEFTCTNARWVFVGEEPRHFARVAPNPLGHVIVHHEDGLLDLDPLGAVAAQRNYDDVSPWWMTAGPDGAGSWFLSFVEDDKARRRWLRKFDVAGDLVWEVDLGLPAPGSGIDVMEVVVAPNGSTVLTDGIGQLHKFAADGTKQWSVQADEPLEVHAMNDAGEIVATSRHTESGPRVFAPDGSLRWQFPAKFAGEGYGHADINAAGEVVVGDAWSGVHVMRFSPAGEVLWNRYFSGMPGTINYLGSLAINDAGLIAIGGRALQPPGVMVMKVDVDGTPLASQLCNAGSVLHDVTLDATGAIYAVGGVDDSHLPFVAVFD